MGDLFFAPKYHYKIVSFKELYV